MYLRRLDTFKSATNRVKCIFFGCNTDLPCPTRDLTKHFVWLHVAGNTPFRLSFSSPGIMDWIDVASGSYM